MKNIWFMLLTVCTMFAFSACSDDDEKNPTNPVSNAKVPATVQIGEEMIITGTGFTAPGIALYLEDAEKIGRNWMPHSVPPAPHAPYRN